jgi:hypothetical protein
MSKEDKIVETEVVSIPRDLAEKTVSVLLSVSVAQGYLLVKGWDEAVPGLIQPT